jgi:hypothetical protein
MAIGDRDQPQKDLDSKLRPNSFQRMSRKREKTLKNRKSRKLARLDPETPKRKKYLGWEW